MRSSRRALRTASAVLVGVVGLATGLSAAAGAPTGHREGLHPDRPASQVITFAELTGVSMVPKSTDAWAIGGHVVENKSATLLVHRHHNHWTSGKIKKPAGYVSLGSIAAGSATSIWIAGDRLLPKSETQVPVIEHSTGGTFKPVTINGAPAGSLESIAASSPTNAWAVGYSSLHLPITMHWNGRKWKTVAVPGATNGMEMLSVSTSSPKNAWAVGNLLLSPEAPFLLHWNGKTWKRVTLPVVQSLSLSAVATTSPTLAWVVGEVIGGTPYIMRWNGERWRVVPMSGPAVEDPTLVSVAAAGSSAYAVGFSFGTTGEAYTNLALRLTPETAQQMPTHSGAPANQLFSVAASTKGAVVVGYSTLASSHISEQLETIHRGKWKPQSAPS